MKAFSGLAINRGTAYGKAFVLMPRTNNTQSRVMQGDQIRLLENAIHKCALRLEEQSKAAGTVCNQAVASVFAAHMLMIKDPLLINRTHELITNNNMSAYEAYHTASRQIVQNFANMNNEYMINRIIDIEDATDRVLAFLQGFEYEDDCDFFEPRILIMDKMRPSTLFNCNKKNVIGLISETGSYNEHSCLIIRCKDIPALIIQDAAKHVTNNDYLLLDGDKGTVFINPDITFLNNYLKERR